MEKIVTLADITDDINLIVKIELWAAKDPVKTDYHARQYIRDLLEPWLFTSSGCSRLLMRQDAWMKMLDILVYRHRERYTPIWEKNNQYKTMLKRWENLDRPRITVGWEQYMEEDE